MSYNIDVMQQLSAASSDLFSNSSTISSEYIHDITTIENNMTNMTNETTLQFNPEALLIYFIYPLLFLCGFIGNLFVITVLLSSHFINTKDNLMQNNNFTSVSRNNSVKVRKPSSKNTTSNMNARQSMHPEEERGELLAAKIVRNNELNNNNNNNNAAMNRAQSKDLLKVTHFFLLNLAISDLFYSTTIPFLIFYFLFIIFFSKRVASTLRT